MTRVQTGTARITIATVAAVIMSGAAVAQEQGGAEGAGSERGGPPKWSVGFISLVNRSPFELENTSEDGGTKYNLQAFPYIAYRGDRFFIDGLELGYRLVKPNEHDDLRLGVDVLAAARPIAGSSRDKITADAGLRVSLDGSFGTMQLTGLRDVTDTHNGTELSARYSYSFNSRKLTVTPSIGVVWQSEKLANYNWGVSEKQQADLIEDDDPVLPLYTVTDHAINFEAGLFANYRFADRWSVIGFANATWLDDVIRDNPGINKKIDATIGLGLAYSF